MYGGRHGGSARKEIIDIPEDWSPGGRKYCVKCRHNETHTARIRIRNGKKTLVRTSKYSSDLSTTKIQMNYIIGNFCLLCGHFEEDDFMKRSRIRRLKNRISSGYNREECKKLLEQIN